MSAIRIKPIGYPITCTRQEIQMGMSQEKSDKISAIGVTDSDGVTALIYTGDYNLVGDRKAR